MSDDEKKLEEQHWAQTLERMHSGIMHIPSGKTIKEKQSAAQNILDEFNLTRPHENERRVALMQEMFAEVGQDVYIEPPLHANWGSKFVHLGKHIYINSSVTLVDDTHIYIGDYSMIGPNVVIATASHPISPRFRQENFQYNLPVTIGKNVWIGSGVQIMPGITIGDNSVIGAGSVVTRDIPENVIAFGNPCRVHREISERDDNFYERDIAIDHDEVEKEIKYLSESLGENLR